VTSSSSANSQANSQAASATSSAVSASIARVQGGGDAVAEGTALANAVAKVPLFGPKLVVLVAGLPSIVIPLSVDRYLMVPWS
jgi:hypothetical protein